MTDEPRVDDESGIKFHLPLLRRDGVRPARSRFVFDYNEEDLGAWNDAKAMFETMFPGRDRRGWFDPHTGSFGADAVHILEIADIHWEDSFGKVLDELKRRDMLEGTVIWRAFAVGHPDGPTEERIKVWPLGHGEVGSRIHTA